MNDPQIRYIIVRKLLILCCKVDFECIFTFIAMTFYVKIFFPTYVASEETSPEVQNRGIGGPTNGHVSNKN